VAFDPFLYVALGIGFGIGRVVRVPTAWVRGASYLTVVALVALLGGSIASLPLPVLGRTIPLGLGFAALLLALTAATSIVLSTRLRGPAPAAPTPVEPRRFLLSVGLLAALVGGFLLGRFVPEAYAGAIPWALYLLLGIVGLDLRLSWASVRRAWNPIASACVGALGAATIAIGLGVLAPGPSLGTSLAFGWYTLAGPLVAARDGALLGLFAFLANFFRENLTMLLSPLVGARLKGDGLSAMGGATSMDTTLYFVTRFGDPDAGGIALTTGLALTLAAGVVVPAVLAL